MHQSKSQKVKGQGHTVTKIVTMAGLLVASFDRSWILLAKTAKSHFVPPFGGLRGNVHGLCMARWKARCRLPISANWTFFVSCHGWGVMSGYLSKRWCFKEGLATLRANFRRRGSSTVDCWRQKTKSLWAITWRCLCDTTFWCNTGVWQTRRHTTAANVRLSLAPRGKKLCLYTV